MNERPPDSLRELGELEREALTDEERDRVRRAIAAAGPGIVRRARLQRRIGATVAVLAMAATLLLGWRALAPAAEIAAHPPTPAQHHAPAPAHDALAPPGPRTCEASAVTPPAVSTDAAGRTRFDLHSVALAVASSGADVQLAERPRCETAFLLRRGGLDVHARDLGGGRLRVVTARGEVVVHGTVFRVVVEDGDAVVVRVVEGVVTIEQEGRVLVRVVGGQQVRLAADVGAPEPLDTAEGAATQRALGLLPASGAPDVTPTAHPPQHVATLTTHDLLDRALAASHDGDLDAARSFYRQAGARDDGDAESAWILLARLELRAGRPAAVHGAAVERERHFPRGALGAEAAWIDVQAADAAGDRVAALAAARALVARYPRTPQAEAARRRFSMQAP